MTDDKPFEGRNKSRPPSGSGSHGDQPPPATDPDSDDPEQPEGDHSEGMGSDVQRTGQVDDFDSEEKVHEAELVTREDLNQILSTFWSGPTPSPQTLAEFNHVNPTFAERAFAMSEQSVAASNDEKVTLAHGDVDALRRGQWFSALLTFAFIVAAIILFVMSGDPLLSGLALAAPIFQYLGKFIRTVRKEENDNIE